MNPVPDPEALVAQIPDDKVLAFARSAQRQHIQVFLGWQLKSENIPYFRVMLKKLVRQRQRLALDFVNQYVPVDAVSTNSAADSDSSTSATALTEMVEAAHDLRKELLEVMRETANRMRDLQEVVKALEQDLQDVKASVDRLIEEDQRVGYLPDNFYSDFINTITAIRRRFLLEKEGPRCDM